MLNYSVAELRFFSYLCILKFKCYPESIQSPFLTKFYLLKNHNLFLTNLTYNKIQHLYFASSYPLFCLYKPGI